MQCDKCRKEAVLFQEYSGLHLCNQHFEADLERKAKHEIRSHHWLVPGDHIAVALSGDANSSALLFFLKKLTSSRRDVRISAIIIDQGIRDYRDPGIVKGIAGLSGTECIRVSFSERPGITLDGIAEREGVVHACTYCRAFRNSLLNEAAIERGVTKIALGDDLDDMSASVLINFLRGIPGTLIDEERTGTGKIPVIRPLGAIPKKEVELYAALHDGKYDKNWCPYQDNAFEKDVRKMLDDFTTRHPATKYALMNLEKNLKRTCFTNTDFPSCEEWRDPTGGISRSLPKKR